MKNFTNFEATPSDFLRIPLGNIDLRSEIRMDAEADAVWRHRERKSVRRMYSARVVGHNEPISVALYQGNNAEEEWKRDISYHSRFRHPHILQIYASASSSGIHATIFYDDLALLPHFLETFRYSAVLTVYIYWYTNAEWTDACTYSASIPSIARLHWTRWIRRSTGRLCMEFSNFYTDDGLFPWLLESPPPPRSMPSLHDSTLEPLVIASLGYPEWYSYCDFYLEKPEHEYVWAAQVQVNLGSILHWPPGSPFQHAIEVAATTDAQIQSEGWHRPGAPEWDQDPWETSYKSGDVFGTEISLKKKISTAWWLAQANYIFSQLKVVLNHEDYKLVREVEFSIEISKATHNPPDGYLIVCSPEDFEISSTSIRWPDRPAYWSLDSYPWRNSRLSPTKASYLGFPSITLSMTVTVSSWDEIVYAGLRKFDACKGFDPESQNLARELGYPLFKRTMRNPPDRYPFNCWPEDYEPSRTSYEWSDHSAYRSFRPSLRNALSHKEASSLGFITPRPSGHAYPREEITYARFDECKGSDPESQDLAKEPG
ncbi:hypothetical protein C8R45DRAFT_1011245, partial [Mycena sanguinolenta]